MEILAALQAKEGEVSIVGDWEQECGPNHDPTRTNFGGSNQGMRTKGRLRVHITHAGIHVGQSVRASSVGEGHNNSCSIPETIL